MIKYQAMWLILLTIMVWVPLLVMTATFIVIWVKIRHSFKSFQYSSYQSSNARSRKKVIRMLLFLIVMELICWAPWAFFIISDFIIYQFYLPQHKLDPNPYPMVKTLQVYSVCALSAVTNLLTAKAKSE